MTRMKIILLELTNFSRVYSGLGKTKVRIDLLDKPNSINLFVGNNGSGKTSIMSCFHPFAYNNATGDSTSNSDLIIAGKDGRKEIVITYGEDVYHIQHVYTRKKDDSITVKSYIQKNNEELNDSGTVTTFKDIIYKELGINETYLTLLSIGNRVDGFVEFTSGERKKFASKIFQELSIFDRYHKIVTTKARKMKTSLSIVSSKLEAFKTIDRSELKNDILSAKSNLNVLNDKKVSLSQDIGGISSQLQELKEVMDTYDNLQKKAEIILSSITELKGKKETSNLSLTNLMDEKEKQLKIVRDIEVALSPLNDKVCDTLDKISDLKNEIQSIEDSLSKMDRLENVAELESLVCTIRNEITTLEKMDTNNPLGVSKEYLIRAGIYLDQAGQLCSKLAFDVEYDSLIGELFESYKKDKTIYQRAENEFQKLSNSLEIRKVVPNLPPVNMSKITNTSRLKCDDTSKSGCPYYNFYMTLLDSVNKSTVEQRNEIRQLEDQLGVYRDKVTILSTFNEVFSYILGKKNELHLPDGVFDPETCIYRFLKTRKVYDEDILTEYIGRIENGERLASLRSELELAEIKLANAENISEQKSSKESELQKKSDMLNDLLKRNEELTNRSKDLSDKLNEESNKLKSLTNDIEYEMQIEDYRKEISIINGKLREIDDKITKVNGLKEKLSSLVSERDNCMDQIKKLELDYQNLIITKENIESLERDEIEIRNHYDNIMMIQDAVSPTKGIPVEFIEFVMRTEMIDKMNDLLDSVYHGSFILLRDEMEINDKEFKIPYKKRNTIVDDISKASDGERAILTITFSLVLIQLSLDKYNIMLLDEIDTSLDYTTRGKFLDLIERYMKMIQSEQLFLISHNNMFDMYPVNVLMTSDQNISSMKNAEVIRLY